MKQIVAESPSNQISISNVVIGSNSIIVQVNNNHVSFLSNEDNGHIRAGFRRITKFPNWNTCSESAEVALARSLRESNSSKVYIFDSLQNLAMAIIANGWK